MRPGHALSLALMALLATAAAGQTMVEHAVITAGAAGAAASSRGIAKSIGSVFSKAKSALEEPARSTVIHSAAPAAQGPKPRPVCADDPGKITAGLAYDALLAKCGVPALKTNDAEGRLLLWFTAKDKQTVVTMAAGKVAAIHSQDAKPKPDDGIVVVQ